MTTNEAADLLEKAKFVLSDMGLDYAAGEAERYETDLRSPWANAETAHAWANYVLPPGRRGRVTLCLNRPETARALAFIAGVLRTIESRDRPPVL